MGEKIKIPNNHIELVNLIFAQLEITYHNQFHKAFKDEVSLNLAKQLWLKKLEIFSLDLIFEAIDELTSKSKFLPSLSQTLEEIKSHYLKKEGIQSIESAFTEILHPNSVNMISVWSLDCGVIILKAPSP